VHHPVQTSRTEKGGFRGPTIRQPIDGDLQVRVMEGLLRSWGLSTDAPRTRNRLAAGAGGWAPAAQGRPARRASPTTGDAGSGDPAYRAAREGGLGEAALRVSVKLKRLLVVGRLSGVGHPRLG
jgi:hypothetical protein